MPDKVPVIVTMTGKLEVSPEDATADDVIRMAGQQWGVDVSKLKEPFVVVHDRILEKYRVVEGQQVIGISQDGREVVRAVLPLKGE